MSTFGDLIKNPLHIVRDLPNAFSGKAQNGQQKLPYLQQTARNLAGATLGKDIVNYGNQHVLGDAAPQTPVPPLQMQSATLQNQPHVQNQLLALMQQMMQSRGGGM